MPLYVQYQQLIKLKSINKNAPPKAIRLSKKKTSFHSLRTSANLSDKSKNKIFDLNNNLIDADKNLSINNNNIRIDKNIMNENEYEINSLKYKDALIKDKRNYSQYYFSLLRINHIILFIFRKNDYNSFIIKIYLFFFSFALYYAINTAFFSDSTMHKFYEDEGSYDFIYQIPQIIYSFIISSVVNTLIKTLSLSEKNILELKIEKNIKNLENKAKEINKTLIIEFRLFFIISFTLLLFFWYYISCFCAIYKNTQLHLIKDSLASFGLSLIYPFGLYLIPGIFRIPSLRTKKKDRECMYKLSRIFQTI